MPNVLHRSRQPQSYVTSSVGHRKSSTNLVLGDANCCGLTETNNCYYHVAYRSCTLSKTGEPTAETAQWERSNSWLFLIFAGVLFRIFQAARRTVELRQKLEYAAPLGSRRNMNVSSVWNVKITEQSNETLLSELLLQTNQNLSLCDYLRFAASIH